MLSKILDGYAVEQLNRDFPFDFLPTTSVRPFRDFLPAPQICNSFFQSALGFPLAKGALR
jgi:hypothetical protein